MRTPILAAATAVTAVVGGVLAPLALVPAPALAAAGPCGDRASDPTGSGDRDHLVIGDLNSYNHEDPLDALRTGGFVDQIRRFGGEQAYGYVFDGHAGYLDHALASRSLVGQVIGAAEWHVNADEPDVLDYDTSFKPSAVDAIYAPDQYRASDHDAALVGIDARRSR